MVFVTAFFQLRYSWSRSSGAMFGDHRFADFMAQRRNNPPSIVFEELAVRLKDWTGEASLKDDVSLILIDREAHP